MWPGNSPDLNPCENVGALLKDKVEKSLHRNPDCLKKEVLKSAVIQALQSMENDTELFEKLLRSFPERIQAVRTARGGHTDY